MSTSAQQYPDDWSDDGAMARAYLGGDAEAFNRLYRRYYPDLYASLVHRVHDHGIAEDLAQETMARAMRYFGGYDPRRPLWPWLHAISRRLAYEEARRRAVEIPVDDAAMDSTYEDTVEAFITRAEVQECLSRIPSRQRHALVLRYVEDRNASEIAAQLDLSRPALEQLMFRSRRSLANVYRMRNGAWLPGLSPLALRLRRLVAAATARLQSFAGAGLSVAGDVALGTALTVGGVTLATGAVTNYVHHRSHVVAEPATVDLATSTPYFPRGDAGSAAVVARHGTTTAARSESRAAQPTSAMPRAKQMPGVSTVPTGDSPAVYPPDPPSTPQPASGQVVDTQEGGVTFDASTGSSPADTPIEAPAGVAAHDEVYTTEDGAQEEDSIIVDTPVTSVGMTGDTVATVVTECDPLDLVCVYVT